jgi:alkylation response protein AidB-like acyl-CoA dehydrogenase
MDVVAREIPASYDGYRTQVRQFIRENCPTLEWKQRAGLRVPESKADLDALRRWVGALYASGYRLARFSLEETDPVEQEILEEELRATSIPYVLGNPLVAGALREFGDAGQKEGFLTAMASGAHIWTQLFSEPDAGSDLTSLRTRASLDGAEYVVNGQKVWSTWAQWADFGYLLARTGGDGAAGISAFVLDMRTPGVDVRPLREMTGTSDFNEVFLSDVRVPIANLIGGEGDGWKVALTSLAMERGAVGSGGSGELVRNLITLAIEQDGSGSVGLRGDGERQAIGALVARSRIQQYLAYVASTRVARNETAAWDSPVTKVWFSELHLDLSEYALALLGPRSMLTEGDPASYEDGTWQDRFLYARALTIAGGTNEVMRNLIAERGLGLPREPRT